MENHFYAREKQIESTIRDAIMFWNCDWEDTSQNKEIFVFKQDFGVSVELTRSDIFTMCGGETAETILGTIAKLKYECNKVN